MKPRTRAKSPTQDSELPDHTADHQRVFGVALAADAQPGFHKSAAGLGIKGSFNAFMP